MKFCAYCGVEDHRLENCHSLLKVKPLEIVVERFGAALINTTSNPVREEAINMLEGGLD